VAPQPGRRTADALVNADRMMHSILPEQANDGALPDWAATLRDTAQSWMKVSQQTELTNSRIKQCCQLI
jgi:hypothetical protein